jgi:predicted nuclease of restriction endonuclease-like (RecB) superfamily
MPSRKELSKKSQDVVAGYAAFLGDLKQRIKEAQVRAALSVNRDLVLLYWQIGCGIIERQRAEGWGSKVIDQLSRDLRREFPTMKGFSPRNLKYMRAFAESYGNEDFVQQVAAQIPWFHNCVLLDKVPDVTEREWYARQTIEHGWSRSVLVLQIENGLYRRHGKALTNFGRTLPAPQSDLAQQVLKDPYNFDFLQLGLDASERDVEQKLVLWVRKFLLEPGVGFAFVGQQYHLEVGDQDFYVDLLFYHLKLRCFVVIELKAVEFQPEFAGYEKPDVMKSAA